MNPAMALTAPGPRTWLAVAAASGLIGVAAGAFGAHGLEGIEASRAGAFETGVRYEMYHALALLAVAWLADRGAAPRAAALAGGAFAAGIVLFYWPLLLLGATGSRALVPVTPLGGVLFMAGWACLALVALGSRTDRAS